MPPCAVPPRRSPAAAAPAERPAEFGEVGDRSNGPAHGDRSPGGMPIANAPSTASERTKAH
eukprot:6250126-Pyramimonas_sp.AAC.1